MPASALARWSRSALRYVELPTGTKAAVVLPDVMTLVRTERLPSELRDIAYRYAKDGISVTEIPNEDLGKFVMFTYELVAAMLRYLADPETDANDSNVGDPAAGWEQVALTAADVAEMEIDQADLDALSMIAGRIRTPNEVTAMSRFDRGLTAPETEPAGSGDRVGDFAGFRGRSGRDADGADSEDVREASERVPRRARSRDRVLGR